MAPRQTMNSLHGRPPPAPRTPRTSNKGRPPASQTQPPAQHRAVEENNENTRDPVWLLCRDEYGVPVHISHSETGEGVHLRWLHPDMYPAWQNQGTVAEVEKDADMVVDDDANEHLSTPQPGSSNQVPQTPLKLHPFDAGSVIRTPLKKPKTKPLQRSPERIGDKGIRCVHEQGHRMGVLTREGGMLYHHPGSAVNLTKEDVARMQQVAEDRIFREQVAKLAAQKRAIDRENEEESGDDQMNTDDPPVRGRVRTIGPDGTIIITDERGYHTEQVTEQPFVTGPNGVRLDLRDRQLFGPDGTVLVDPNFSPRRGLPAACQPLGPVPTERINFPNEGLGRVEAEQIRWEFVPRRLPENRRNGENTTTARPRNTRPLMRQRLGPEGTELIDL